MMRVRVRWTGTTVVGGGLSTHYFTGTEDQTAANNAVAAVAAFWGAIDNQLGNSTSWSTDPIVSVLDNSGNQTGQFTVSSSSGSGSLSALYAPVATQGLVQWRTGSFINGRELRGRTFIPGIVAANVNGSGSPLNTFVTAVNTAAAALVGDPNSQLALWSKRFSAVSTISAGSMWTQYAVLRSRRD